MKEYNVKVDWLWYVGISLDFPNKDAVIIANKSGRILYGVGGYRWAKKINAEKVNVIFKEDYPNMTLNEMKHKVILERSN